MLAVVRVRRDELTANRLVDLPENRVNLRQEVVCRVTAEILDTWLIQAETIPELLGGGT